MEKISESGMIKLLDSSYTYVCVEILPKILLNKQE